MSFRMQLATRPQLICLLIVRHLVHYLYYPSTPPLNRVYPRNIPFWRSVLSSSLIQEHAGSLCAMPGRDYNDNWLSLQLGSCPAYDIRICAKAQTSDPWLSLLYSTWSWLQEPSTPVPTSHQAGFVDAWLDILNESEPCLKECPFNYVPRVQ